MNRRLLALFMLLFAALAVSVAPVDVNVFETHVTKPKAVTKAKAVAKPPIAAKSKAITKSKTVAKPKAVTKPKVAAQPPMVAKPKVAAIPTTPKAATKSKGSPNKRWAPMRIPGRTIFWLGLVLMYGGFLPNLAATDNYDWLTQTPDTAAATSSGLRASSDYPAFPETRLPSLFSDHPGSNYDQNVSAEMPRTNIMPLIHSTPTYPSLPGTSLYCQSPSEASFNQTMLQEPTLSPEMATLKGGQGLNTHGNSNAPSAGPG
ncbi:hypothetical protein FB451DRAFT_1420218 [Mycena latifolia]|nr:hypothetical protein FB451DRAFT_1420218 [Mycena latifolia]